VGADELKKAETAFSRISKETTEADRRLQNYRNT
jgi:hypothetical protein